jgi:hypothetical protein
VAPSTTSPLPIAVMFPGAQPKLPAGLNESALPKRAL